jgi:HAD superfamily hydrolase (TIGR01509 family)
MSRYPQKQALVRARMIDSPPVFPATLEIFGELESYKLAVVSSSGHAEIDPVLKAAGLWPRLATVICGEDVQRHKPAPDPYLKAAGILGSRNPLVIEDSNVGEQSGRAAGFDVLRIASAEGMAEVLRRFLDGGTVSL